MDAPGPRWLPIRRSKRTFFGPWPENAAQLSGSYQGLQRNAEAKPARRRREIQLAAAQLQSGDYVHALEAANEVLTVAPASMEGRLARARALLASRQLDKAAQDLAILTKGRADSADLHATVGMLHPPSGIRCPFRIRARAPEATAAWKR